MLAGEYHMAVICFSRCCRTTTFVWDDVKNFLSRIIFFIP